MALSTTLCWNFIDLGADPPHAVGADAGLIAVGVAFGLMALSGLTPLVRLSSSRVSPGAHRGEDIWGV